MSDDQTPATPPMMLVPGHGGGDTEPAFDASAVASTIDTPRSGPTYLPGEFAEPTTPMLPPPGVEVPADLAEAITEWHAAYDKWRDSAERVGDYQDEARASRAKRAAAIRAAGEAEVAGRKRPSIPRATSEEAEAEEVAILSAVVRARCREADAASAKVTRATIAHAAGFIDPVAEGFAPALAEAREALSAAIQAVGRLAGIHDRVVSLRAQAHFAALQDAGARLSTRAIPALAREYHGVSVSERHRLADAYSRAPWHLLSRAQEALEDFAQVDHAKMPHVDTVKPVGATDGQALVAYVAMRDRKATPAPA